MVVLGEGAFSYERGTPVLTLWPCLQAGVSYERGTPVLILWACLQAGGGRFLMSEVPLY